MNRKVSKRARTTIKSSSLESLRALQSAFSTLLSCISLPMLLAPMGCGQALPFEAGVNEGAAVGKANQIGVIYPVTQVIPASALSWTPAQLPFTGAAVGLNQAVVNGQTQFQFNYSYPPNNFQLADSRLIIDTLRDTSNTEGILVDGVFSGLPPSDQINATASKVNYRIYQGNTAGQTPNVFFNSWSYTHYKNGEINTFDIEIDKLLTTTPAIPVSLYSMLNDGNLPVVTGDDSRVNQAFLVISGYTISKTPLSCTTSSPYTFQNVLLHNDFNSTGDSFFDGTVKAPSVSWTTARDATFQSVDFHFDAALPKTTLPAISITNGTLRISVKRAATGLAALVVNGVGVAETGFDTLQASDEVEVWRTDSAAVTKWEAFVASIPANDTQANVILDIADILGANVLKDLIAQGKLNITLAGSLGVVYGQALTSTRSQTVLVAGPELVVSGTYTTKLCTIPNDPTSPLSGAAPAFPDPGSPEGIAPVISSVQAVEVTANSAKVLWLSDEWATSRVIYGPSGTEFSSPASAPDPSDTNNLHFFHEIDLTGLAPYTYYFFRVVSEDYFGNQSVSAMVFFRTLR